MYKKQVCLAVVLLTLAASTMVQAEVFIDDFNTPHDYVADGVAGTIWDDFFGLLPGETVAALNASVDRVGQLFMSSRGGFWSNNDSPLGPFLYKVVNGDFIASVKITDYAGTPTATVLHNDGGLMARAFLDDAGLGEDWISIDYFPIWSCGNFLWLNDDGVRNEAWGCNNGKRWDLDPWLQMERKGNTFYIRTSTDGITWKDISCSPKTRDDFDGLPLMVGLRHATYNTTLGYVAFDHFRLETVVKLKAYDPVPTDSAEGVTSPLLQWTAGDTAAFHDVYFGTNPTPGEDEYQGRQALTTYSYAPGLIPGTTYYWRIDEVEADGTTIHEGDVWSFTATSLTAWNPNPPDGAQGVLADVDLSWGAGSTANQHEVYFGTDETAVADATISNPMGVYKGNQPGTTYEPGNLAKNTTYYWRIDEAEDDGTTYKGPVWSFKTLHDISIYSQNLVGWWKLDNISYGTNVIDSSGYNHHGTFIGGNPQWIAGYDGDALEFDGRDDYVELPIGSVIASLTNCSITTWANFANAGGAWQHLFDFGNDTDVYMFLTPRIFFIDPMRFAITTAGGGAEDQADAPDTLPSGWHHVAVTIDADTDAIVLYQDGEEVATGNTALTPSDLGNTTNNWLGRSQYADDAYFMGSLDDFRIYNYALTEAEIPETMRGDPLLAWNPKPADTAVTDIEKALPLIWTPGEQAAQHDVYLGTDEVVVESADTSDTTGIYRGRQDANSYTPPESVEPNQVYYWRIDEVNTDTTISKGRIWSFTVAEYLIVDDFEDYDDVNRIFDIWADYFVNNTGMTVGYFDPPYAEQTIVHSGRQSMYMRYDNDGTVNEGTNYEQSGMLLYSEAEREWPDPQDWTRKGVNSLTLWFRGIPASVGSFTVGPPITMTAAGVDIWGTADQFHFAYKRLSGAGSITARVVSITNTDPWAKAGVMIRQSLDADSAHAIVVVTPGNGVAYEYRPAAGGDSIEEAVQSEITAPQWVKLTRSGNNFTAEYSANGTTWNTLGAPIVIPILADVYIGLCLTSHNVNATCTAEFSNVTMSSTVTGDWQSQDIGIASNIPEPMYVVLEDSAANSAVVKNPDPAATAIGSWTEWNIPLTEFTGVNLQAIKKMTIGVGDRANPQVGSAGDLYIDDIWLYLLPPAE